MSQGKHAAEDKTSFQSSFCSSGVQADVKPEVECECTEEFAPQEKCDSGDKSFVKTFLSVLLAVILIFPLTYFLRAFVVEPYSIPSGSMEQTIMTGDSVLGEKVSYLFRNPAPGDIVTFTDPEAETRLLIKRVVATEGQEVNLVNGKLVVDGVEQNYDYTNGLSSYPLPNSIAIKSYPYTVPEGYVFVMGDNRENSQDSRYFGAIDVKTIQSRAFLVYWPFNHIRGL